MTERDYDAFLESKAMTAPPSGLEDVPPLGDYLFPFQKDLTSWALRRGKAALFEAVGLGKTRQQLTFAQEASAFLEAEGKPSDVIILTPLAVAAQTVREAELIGMTAKYCKTPEDITPGMFTVTNYDRLDRFESMIRKIGVVVIDESSILKHSDSKTRDRIITAFKRTPFRLACTATPAPNDRKELGNHSEFLSVQTQQEMLSEFFVHDSGTGKNKQSKWRLKGHAEKHFWRWVASWGAVVAKPSDLGYPDDGYNLPPLHIHDHVIGATTEQDRLVTDVTGVAQLNLIPMPARSLKAQRKARRVTLEERVKAAVEIVMREPDEQWIVWCELCDEGDALERMLAAAIPGAIQIEGSDSSDKKEAAILGFATGSIRVLVTKTKIAGWGVNWQSCARLCYVGVSHSFEAVHQSLGRCYRFGQQRPVHAYFVYSELEGDIRANLARKEREFKAMQEAMRGLVSSYVRENVRGTSRDVAPYNPTVPMTIPAWLRSENA